MKKRVLSFVLLLAVLVSFAAPTMAEETPAQETAPTETVGATAESPVPTTEPVGATAESPVLPMDAAEKIYPVEEPLGAIKSGTCGDNVTWSYDTSTKVLTISGSGAMNDYSDTYSNGAWRTTAPWGTYGASIKTVIIENGVTSIGSCAFYGCSSLTSIEIPDSVTSIGDWAFSYCSNLTSIVVSPNNPYYDSRENCNAIIETATNTLFYGCKNTVIPDSVTSIRYNAFYGCRSLTSVTIPDSVTSIGDHAFYYCSSLTSIEIPDSVTSIGDHAFYYCTSLTSVTIPDSVTSIGGSAFIDCSNLTSVTIPNSVTSIGGWAFGQTPWLAAQGDFVVINGILIAYQGTGGEITIPDSVTSIGDRAFYDCSSLTSVTIPDSVTSIGSFAFFECSSLTSATIGNSVTSIGEGAFRGCTSLTSVTIPDSVTSIGSSAFYDCDSLTSVTIPSSVASIGDSSFWGCSSLTSVTIPDSVTAISNHAFQACGSLTSVTIPDSVTSIGNQAFYYCSSLTSIEIPDSVTSIGLYAFEWCSSLTSITIPDSVTSIGNLAFYNCSSLDLVHYAGTAADWGKISIGSYNTKLTSATRHYLEKQSKYNCIDGGYTDAWYCSKCKEVIIKGEEFAVVGEHTYEALTPYPATCTEEGRSGQGLWCSVCHEVFKAQTVIPALGHDYVHHDGKAATCTEKGYKVYNTCSRCDYTTYQEIAVNPNAHDLIHHEGKAPTCVESGYAAYDTCSRCEYTTFEELPPAHSYDEDAAVEATCSHTGLTTGFSCHMCGLVYLAQQETPIDPNNHEAGETVLIAGQNGEPSKTAICCSGCHKILEETQAETEIANVSVSGGKITIVPKDETETASVFLAAYNEKGQMVGIYKATIKDGKYEIQTKQNVQDYTWKAFFVDGKNCPKYMAHLLKFA